MKKPTKEKVRDKCDGLLTPIVKKQTPQCEGCGMPTQVAHHWIEKSRSLFLRYDLRNLIALCHSCHAKIHNRFGNSVTGSYDVATKIIKQRGKKWKETMEREGRQIVKADIIFYQKHLERLSKLV
jgi:5-methylcytosine-specific restriction endonuclease McrA